MGAHRPEPAPVRRFLISVASMTWITGENPSSDDAWPEIMASMAPASSCAIGGSGVW